MVALLPNDYVEDILHQGEALQDTLAALVGMDFRVFQPWAQRLASGAVRRVVLTGMGSSLHALQPLWLTLAGQSLPAILVETSELIHHALHLLGPDSLVIAVSQSGRSVELLRLLEKAGSDVPVIGVTNSPGSPLVEAALAAIVTRAGAEHAVSCKTYVVALAALACLGEVLLGRDPAAVLAELQAAPAAVAGYLAELEAYIGALGERMKGVRHLVLAGRGPSLAATGTGGLIMKEAAHFAAEGMSSAAFRHGPINLVSPEVLVVIYEGVEPTRAMNAGLVKDIEAAGGRAALVSVSPEPDVFHLPAAPAVCLPILEILPAQVLSVALALQSGQVPGRFTHGSKVTTVE